MVKKRDNRYKPKKYGGSGVSRRHEKIVDRICELSSASRFQFRRNVIDFILNDEWNKSHIYLDSDDLKELEDALNFIPDAFLIIPGGIFGSDLDQLICWEVQDQHHISDERICTYHHAFRVLDEYYMQIRLISVDRYGNEYEIPILDAAFKIRENYEAEK